VRILVAEKDRNGRSFLERMLRLDGHEVVIAAWGKPMASQVEELRPDLVLMNVFRSLHGGKPPVGKVSVQCGGGNMPTVFVNCIGECEQLGPFTAEENDALFDRLPAKVKIGAMERIQHLCSTLSRYKRQAESNRNFDWHQAIQSVGAASCA